MKIGGGQSPFKGCAFLIRGLLQDYGLLKGPLPYLKESFQGYGLLKEKECAKKMTGISLKFSGMRCTTYCTADAYDLLAIREFYHERVLVAPYRDSLHLSYLTGQVFLFSYGCLVCWGLTAEEESRLLFEIKSFEKGSYKDKEYNCLSFTYGDTAAIQKDVITIPQNEAVMAKLAISYGLAQQIKLSVFESRIDETIENTRNLPKFLAQNGYIPMSRREISRKIGQLFMVRSSVNLHSDILDTPDFFWEYTSLKPLYLMTAGYFSVAQRTEVLNKRCDIIHELFQMLGEDLANRSTIRVEWIIVALISIEIILTILQIFHLI
jgi:uncharacterized Rmd1/YagE family protein